MNRRLQSITLMLQLHGFLFDMFFSFLPKIDIRFKIDEHYVGEPPAVEITISNMNDNVDENFLRNLLQKCGPTEEQIIYRHPRTQRRVGIARIVFLDVKSARACIEKYNQQSVMGNVMNVFHDAFGEQCKQLLVDASGEKKAPKTVVQPPQPPPIPPPSIPPQMPAFKAKDELVPHSHESDPYYQMDYTNPYSRSGSVSGGHTSTDHKPEDSDWNNSRDKYDEYSYVDEQRHYRPKESRRWDRDRDWDSKSSRYHKLDKDRDRRTDRRDYRSHRDDRDRERRWDYDYERKDRRDRDSRRTETKYRSDYKKPERDYMPPIDSSFSHSSSSSSVYASTSHHHTSHHPTYPAFDTSSTSFHQHQYPPLP